MVPYQVKKHPHCSTRLTQFSLACPSFTSCPGKACCSWQAMHLHSSPHILFPQLNSPPINCWYNCGGTFPAPCCGLGRPDSFSIPYYVLISPTGRVLCYYAVCPFQHCIQESFEILEDRNQVLHSFSVCPGSAC